MDPQEAELGFIRRQRSPLTDLYNPYICASDTSVQDARRRLERALEQTRLLRKAFTERVYGKYRVCLVPPPPSLQEIIKPIQEDPSSSHLRLLEEIEKIRLEKEMEKKEALQLNTELAKSSASNFNIDHAEQLMYLSAGLNFVILPEDTKISPCVLENYCDGRGPMLESGQRNRAISHAAATSGDVILERTRKAIAMREERLRQNPNLLSPGQSTIFPTSTASQLTLVLQQPENSNLRLAEGPATVPAASTTGRKLPETVAGSETLLKASLTDTLATGPKKPAGGPTAKQSRGRTTAILSASSLLSLHPHSDQLDASQRQSASTAALVARGISSFAPNGKTQWRLRHPHPESLGGRRRSGNIAKENNQFSQALLDLTLPPLPTAKDRMERKPLAVLSTEDAGTRRAKKAVRTVLQPFQGHLTAPRPVPYTGLLHHIWKSADKTYAETETNNEATAPDSDLDPFVAYLVLSSIGLIGESSGSRSTEALKEKLENHPIGRSSDNLNQIHLELCSTGSSFTETFKTMHEERRRKRSMDETEANECEGASKRIRQLSDQVGSACTGREQDSSSAVAHHIPVQSIRGGGDACNENDDDTGSSSQRTDPHQTPSQDDNSAMPWPSRFSPSQGRGGIAQGLRSDASAPGLLDLAQSMAASGTIPRYLTPQERYHTASGLNALQLAQQLQTTNFHNQSAERTANNLAYLPRVPQLQDGFVPNDVYVQAPTVDGVPAQPTLALGIARQNQLVAAFAREQQTAVFHGANSCFQHTGARQFQQVKGAHPSAVAALLGNPNQYLAPPQYSVQTPMATQFAQPMFSPVLETDSVSDWTIKTGDRSDQNQRRETTRSNKPKIQEKAIAGNNDMTSFATAAGLSEFRSQSDDKTSTSGSDPTSASHFSIEERQVKERSLGVQPDIDSSMSCVSARNNRVSGSPPRELKSVQQAKATNVGTEAAKLRQPEKASSQSTKHIPHVSGTLELTSVRGGHTSASSKLDSGKKSSVRGSSEIAGLTFIEPETPGLLDSNEARLIRFGRFHAAAEGNIDLDKMKAALGYLLSLSTAVPIPKPLIASPLKECMDSPYFKSIISEATSINHDVVASAISIWLWASHEFTFQNAFARSGRIDVDPDCKWLIQTSLELCVRELLSDISKGRDNGLHAQLAGARTLLMAKRQGGNSDVSLENSVSALIARVNFHSAAVVSRTLSKDLSVYAGCNDILPKFLCCISYVDEARLVALQSKACERTLLANLISRKATMTESFAHAYVSSLVRAGEAIGHGKLFEAVQNEELGVSTSIPYDVFTDDSNEWEDPCKPSRGMFVGLNSDDLTKRAHARAMIQKSLRKLQDKQNIKGGVLSAGPYADPGSINARSGQGGKFHPGSSPRGGIKRKYSSSDPPVPPGTGSAKAMNWSVYNPRHFTEPLEWTSSALEVLPYGKHSISDRPRGSLSQSLIARSSDSKRPKKARPSEVKAPKQDNLIWESEEGFPRSTLEIPWSDVADIFQRVELPKKSSSSRSSGVHHESTPLPVDGKIFAPFCRKVGSLLDDTEESDSEEAITDDAVLCRHEVVLDRMKLKLSQYMEERKKQQERRKSRSKGRS